MDNEVIVIIDKTYTFTKIMGVFDSFETAINAVNENKKNIQALSFIKLNMNEATDLTIFESNIDTKQIVEN